MRKKKFLSLLIFSIVIFNVASSLVFAGDLIPKKTNASVTLSNQFKTGIILGNTGRDMGLYTFDVKYNGLNFVGYCLDYDFKASRHYNYTCYPENDQTSKMLAYAYDHRTGNNLVDALTMRFIAIRQDKAKDVSQGQYGDAYFVLKWLQMQTGQFPSGYFKDSEIAHGNEDLMLQAFNLSTEAINAIQNGTSESIKTTLEFTNKKVNGNEVTYTVKSNRKLKKNQIDFTCQGCEIKNKISDTWNGTEGTLTIVDTKDDCSYTIEAYYPASSAIMCTCGVECQQIEIFATTTDDEPVDTKTSAPTQYFSDTIDEGDYYKNTCGGEANKCNEPIPEDVVNVNNCCEDSTHSEIKEPSLNDLFCRDTDLNVDYYKPKVGAQKYLFYDTDLDTDYCQMYCTERIEVDIPGAMTATNGKYFQLQTNSVTGTYAPHVESTKRCRIRVEYDKWISDYQEQVNNSIKAYNTHQENSASYEMYQYAVEHKETINVGDVYVNCSAGGHDSNYKKGNYSYDKYNFKNEPYNYRKSKIDNPLREKYTSEKVLDDGGYKKTHGSVSVWKDDLGDTISAISEAMKKNGTNSPYVSGATYYGPTYYQWSCSASAGAQALLALSDIEDVEAARDNYLNTRNAAKDSYTAAVNRIDELQKTLTRCDKYFTDLSVSSTSSPEYMYNVPTSMSNFKYTQVYQDDYGNPKQAQVTVGFNGNCSLSLEAGVDGVDTFAVSGSGNNYSSDPYGRIYENMIVFGKDLTYDPDDSTLTSPKYHEKFLADEEYKADKMFWHDGKYVAKCDWQRTDVDKYTISSDGTVVDVDPSKSDNIFRLVPRGEIYNYKQSIKNFTEHEYVVSFSTSYDGHFETYWNLKGLGENGKFDTYFENAGNTCAAQNPADTELLTCRLHAFHGGSFYGCCCGDGNSTTYSTATCDSYSDKAVLYDFKIIDPSNVFPASTEGYANNWKTATGEAAKNAIEELGKNLNTYSPKTLSYSFRLTPSDMKQIKKYNSLMNGYGGYTDNDLSCSCEEGQGSGNKDNGKSCVKCTSNFLDNIANGKILNDETLQGGWNRTDKTLQQVRSSDNVKWAVNK